MRFCREKACTSPDCLTFYLSLTLSPLRPIALRQLRGARRRERRLLQLAQALEHGGGLVAFGGGFTDGAAVAVHGQGQADAERPFGLALVKSIAGVEVEVGCLFGDFQAESGIGRRVIFQGPEDVAAADQRGLAQQAPAGVAGK